MTARPMKNRVTEMTGTDYPIIQAPMGWIARAKLASAVSNAGGLGIIETSSGEFDNIRNEVAKMRDLTDKPFGMNVALSYVKGTNVIDFVIEQGIKFVTTSSGSPSVCTKTFQEAGIKVFHVVPTFDMALKALDCGVDGLVVEGGEGGGFKNPSPVSTMVLLPLIRSRTDVPIIAAGGICDGLSMAGAFAMGAEGVQMGTRMLSCADSPVHDNWKQAVVAAKETDTVFLNQASRPALRALRTERTSELLPLGAFNAMEHFAGVGELYFGGDMEAAIPLSGQVVGRIDSVKSADEIVQGTMTGFYSAVDTLASTYTG
ncbi:putative 2-nitropropane dioxygenase, NPD [Halioglobus japonicus]|uniref:Nitronate monooxygenase n=1 Tax=Halioglobus japonicus TaxID=930805 RepID=A0AAP8MHR1_9GAMM|nr:nitronate monooxygenase [Halioglobus japonicus]PLW87697.1 nitronate monooxygenase [Halioglobus japonicus]GHD07051.1 putative 2-nitropropane dioxygenase, NPD [Halioglobus japonicus]